MSLVLVTNPLKAAEVPLPVALELPTLRSANPIPFPGTFPKFASAVDQDKGNELLVDLSNVTGYGGG